MRIQLLKYWERLRFSFWFLPSLMAAGAVILAFATVALDEAVSDRWLRSLTWVYTGGAQGASAVLQTISGSMVTIAGLVFSLTLVALTLASSQFGSRLVRNFMRDTATQLVLGTFVATFMYCLLVLRTIRRAEEGVFVPHISVTVGVAFALVSLWVLIYFIHHVAVSIQADEIVARVAEELTDGIDRLYPEQTSRGQPLRASDAAAAGVPDAFDQDARDVFASYAGYLQIVDTDALVLLARDCDALFRLERRPGQYVVQGRPLVKVWPASRMTDALAGQVNSAFVLGNQRTSAQDVEFALQELVEVAVRALSPGVNDPFTAIVCIDRLGSALCRLSGRDPPASYRLDGAGRLRMIVAPADFAGLVDVAFNQIRQYAQSSVAVTIRLLEIIAIVAAATERPERLSALRCHAVMIARGARQGIAEEEDRLAVEERYLDVTNALSRQASGR